ncbi:hypothetical protein [Streptosporangium sp. V21-05]
MILEAFRRGVDAITVTILLGITAIVVESFVRDWRNGWRPWHWDSWNS